jgi:hypothetical protein
VKFAEEWRSVKITPAEHNILFNWMQKQRINKSDLGETINCIPFAQIKEQNHWKRRKVAPRSNATRTTANMLEPVFGNAPQPSSLRAGAGDASPADAPHCQISAKEQLRNYRTRSVFHVAPIRSQVRQ